jgi:hypothetical protein
MRSREEGTTMADSDNVKPSSRGGKNDRKLSQPAPGYSPRVIVKFRNGVQLPYDERVEQHLDELRIGPWRQLKTQFSGISMRKLFTSVGPERIQQLVDEAVRRDGRYDPPDFQAYFVVDCPADVNPDEVVKALSTWRSVQTAYFDPPGSDPLVNALNDPRSPNQGYLDPAPDGIDAEFAWGFAGGDGAGQNVIDLERGWTLTHEDLTAHGSTLLHGCFSTLPGPMAPRSWARSARWTTRWAVWASRRTWLR